MKVEIFSDVACPWCYIGKRRFEAALARFPHHEQVEVTWRSYQLDPSAPRDPGKTVTEILAQKYAVSLAQAAAMNERVSALAAKEGLVFAVNEKYGVSGAQPAELFGEVLERAWTESHPSFQVGRVPDGTIACEGESCPTS